MIKIHDSYTARSIASGSLDQVRLALTEWALTAETLVEALKEGTWSETPGVRFVDQVQADRTICAIWCESRAFQILAADRTIAASLATIERALVSSAGD